MGIAATIVLIPGSPLGLLTVGVQTLAGVLLPSATVFLLLVLCNDCDVLGPWVNGRWLNAFTAAVVFPAITGTQIVAILAGGSALAVVAAIGFALTRVVSGFDGTGIARPAPVSRAGRESWRMPPLGLLTRPRMSTGRRTGLTVLRGSLLVAVTLVVIRIIQLATAG